MKIGLISDVHGDPLALAGAWAHLKTLGADAILCAGDVVGYGPRPDEVVAFLKEHQVPCVRGNHDRWAVDRGPGRIDPFGGPAPSTATLAFLTQLPGDVRLRGDDKVVVVVHGSPRADMEFITEKDHPPTVLRGWLAELRCQVLVHGHTHLPMLYRTDLGIVVNPGSTVINARVSTSRTFALLELATLTVSFHDVESGSEVAVRPWF
jgi:putative phosphoesterase